jgi:hypothetical protein
MELDDYLTESEIVRRTGANQPTVHKWLKKHMDKMVTRKFSPKITLYLIATLPDNIKILLANPINKKGAEAP